MVKIVASLARGEQDSAKLSFMDGPYALFLSIGRQTRVVTISSEEGNFEAKSSIDEIEKQMDTAIRSVQQGLSTVDSAAGAVKQLDGCLELIGQGVVDR